jgi:hypothetical protein
VSHLLDLSMQSTEWGYNTVRSLMQPWGHESITGGSPGSNPAQARDQKWSGLLPALGRGREVGSPQPWHLGLPWL